MKIKWKITLIIALVLVSIIIVATSIFQVKTKDLVASKTEDELQNYSNLGFSLLDKYYPGDWSIDGDLLYKGEILINENFEVVDEFAKDTGILATVFANDTRVATTVVNYAGERQISTQASEAVIDKVLHKGENYKGTAKVVGNNADTYYVPITDKNGSVIGMWFVGIYSDVINDSISEAMISTLVILAILAVIGIIFSYLLGKYVAKGYILLQGDLEMLEKGNFHVIFQKGSMKRKDEIGQITRSFDNMQKKVRSIISSIKEETAQINSSSTILAENADKVYRNVEDISATTQELSAGMEETAASSEEMNATTITIDEEINRVTEKAVNGQMIAAEIKGRAEKLRNTATESQKTAVEIYDRTNIKLRSSLEKASAINEIKSLSKTILDITAQTNLLALNASIESARAGEVGKGFAVVATEIGVLAQNSKRAVSQINTISNEIASAVSDIVENSKFLLNFVDTKVIKDYEVLVTTSEQYNVDANTVEEMVNEIKNSATQLNESIGYIRQAVEEVTIATDEGSRGSAEIAEKSTAIFHQTNEVLEQANSNKKIVEDLNKLLQFFQV